MAIYTYHIENKVLVVTPQPEMLIPITRVIQAVFHYHITVVKPYQMLDTLRSSQPDMLLIDMHVSAEAFVSIHHCKKEFPSVPVVAMVPYGNAEMVDEVTQKGADDYITQPIALERLKTTLRNAIRLRELLQALESKGYHDIINHYEPASAAHVFGADVKGLKPLRSIEDMAIEHAMQLCEGCITQAAKALGVGRSTLYRKLQNQPKSEVYMLRENQISRPRMSTSSRSDS